MAENKKHHDNEELSSSSEDNQHRDSEGLEVIAFHFTQVCKRLSQDREHWAETGKDLAGAVGNLNSTLEKFAELDKKTQEQVMRVISEGSYNAARIIAEALGEKTEAVLTQQIKNTTNHLNKTVREASETLLSYQWQISSLKKWFLIGVILSSLIGNILAGSIVYYFLSARENNNALAIIQEIRGMERREKIYAPAPTASNRSKVQPKLFK